MELEECKLVKNATCGVFGSSRSKVVLLRCKSVGHQEGYKAAFGCCMTLQHCCSDKDTAPCGATMKGRLSLQDVKVDGVARNGVVPAAEVLNSSSHGSSTPATEVVTDTDAGGEGSHAGVAAPGAARDELS